MLNHFPHEGQYTLTMHKLCIHLRRKTMNNIKPFIQRYQDIIGSIAGLKYPLPDSYLHTEGSFYFFGIDISRLLILIENPTPEEIADFQFGTAKLGLFFKGPLLFLLSKFGSQPWADAAYSIHMNPIENRGLPENYVEGSRFGLVVMLVDSATSIIQAARFITLTPEFSLLLARRAMSQLQQPLTRSELIQLTYEAYQSHPTVKSMVKQTQIVISCPYPH
jgi:hypothetical protein